ncbi:MAG: L-serine ammonia-lyase [Vicinamibacteria bacterium]|nr:L-serine ammonia-lyase [Vicinamibacteria bacterium]
MESIRELFRIGNGPSSSHSMGPRRAADRFLSRHPGAASYRVTLYGSLAATGKGHLTDVVLEEAFGARPHQVIFNMQERLPRHPNGMLFEAMDAGGQVTASWKVYSVGGGAIRDHDLEDWTPRGVYELSKMTDILRFCREHRLEIWQYVEEREGAEIWQFLAGIHAAMQAAIDRGLAGRGILPGVIRLPRKAKSYHARALARGGLLARTGTLSAYGLAVSEENAAGGIVVTAPTCGGSGVVPAVMRYLSETLPANENAILRALATAGLIGNLIKTNASISGAAVGCQGEVGAACAMAAGAAAQLMGGTIDQIEYAAEVGMEHHLGLTCDPVAGLVQIPCIERNAVAADRAVHSAEFSMLSDGAHHISFDEVIEAMRKTGADLHEAYRETSIGGLAGLATSPQNVEPNECA